MGQSGKRKELHLHLRQWRSGFDLEMSFLEDSFELKTHSLGAGALLNVFGSVFRAVWQASIASSEWEMTALRAAASADVAASNFAKRGSCSVRNFSSASTCSRTGSLRS